MANPGKRLPQCLCPSLHLAGSGRPGSPYLAKTDCTVTLKLPDDQGKCLIDLFAHAVDEAIAQPTHTMQLPAYGYRWLRLGDAHPVEARSHR